MSPKDLGHVAHASGFCPATQLRKTDKAGKQAHLQARGPLARTGLQILEDGAGCRPAPRPQSQIGRNTWHWESPLPATCHARHTPPCPAHGSPLCLPPNPRSCQRLTFQSLPGEKPSFQGYCPKPSLGNPAPHGPFPVSHTNLVSADPENACRLGTQLLC